MDIYKEMLTRLLYQGQHASFWFGNELELTDITHQY